MNDGVDKPKENNTIKKKHKHKNPLGLAAYGHLIGILWPRGGREANEKAELRAGKEKKIIGVSPVLKNLTPPAQRPAQCV